LEDETVLEKQSDTHAVSYRSLDINLESFLLLIIFFWKSITSSLTKSNKRDYRKESEQNKIILRSSEWWRWRP